MTEINPEDYQDLINWNVLGEIISMDEDNPSFSQMLISTFINQVLDTFSKLDHILRQIMPGDIDYDRFCSTIINKNIIEVPDEFSEISQPQDSSEGFSKEIEHELELNKEKDLSKLQNPKNIKIQLSAASEYGHYIKGSASSLGFFTLQKYCERIQNYGNYLNYDSFQISKDNDKYFSAIDENYDNYLSRLLNGGKDNDEIWVFMVKNSLDNAKEEFNKLRNFFRLYYKDERF